MCEFEGNFIIYFLRMFLMSLSLLLDKPNSCTNFRAVECDNLLKWFPTTHSPPVHSIADARRKNIVTIEKVPHEVIMHGRDRGFLNFHLRFPFLCFQEGSATADNFL